MTTQLQFIIIIIIIIIIINIIPGTHSRILPAYAEVIFLLWTSSVILVLMEHIVSEAVSASIFMHFI